MYLARKFLYVALVSIPFLFLASTAAASCSSPSNAIEAENCKVGNPASQWDLPGADAGDASIQGYATDISVNVGQTVNFKVNTNASAYTIDIYRMGYYGGMGARQVDSILPSVSLPQTQPACTVDGTTGLIDCGTWAISASWVVPADAVSGIYFAKLTRSDTGGSSHIVFVVRNDSSHSDLLFQTSDTTWQAYNYSDGNSISGGNSLYGGHGPGTGYAPGRAYKVSYNRPITTRSTSPEDFVFNAEYPMVRFLEANGFDVTYSSGIDAERHGSQILNHKAYLSVGHDEYWSGSQRANVEAARAAGVHLAFFSGNEGFWKTRFEASPVDNDTYRTLVCYKETHAGTPIDPLDPPTWTGTWRDPRFSPPADGGRPENGLNGTIFTVNCCTYNINVPESDGRMRFWRNTAVATLGSTETAALPYGTLGYEWDEDLDNGFRPAGLFHLSTTTVSVPQRLLDYGSNYGPGSATHSLTLYKHSSGALVFGAGSVQWSWGLDGNHDRGASTPDTSMQQATVNLLADMGVQPATLQSPLTPASPSSDTVAPTSSITFPLPGGTVSAGIPVTITGDATDAGGGVVGGVEISLDGGATWHPASGRESWMYFWTPSVQGTANITVRAVDDSGNLEGRGGESLSTIQVTVAPEPPPSCPCSVFNDSGTPTQTAANDHDPQVGIENGVRFTSDDNGTISGIQFYRGATDSGTYQVHLWDNSGNLLGSASITFKGASSPAWQQVSFTTPIAITANTPYVASVFSPNGFYAATDGYFTQEVTNPPLHFLQDGASGPNGIYIYTSAPAFPTQSFQSSNYWVDVVFNAPGLQDHTPPTITSISPAAGASGVSTSATVSVTFDKAMNATTINSATFVLRDPANNNVPATVIYEPVTFRATLIPNSTLATSATYAVTVVSGTNGVQDTHGNALSSDAAWSFSTEAAPPPPPTEGPGGPILIISSSTNPFSRYYVEILENEGLNEFLAMDISQVTSSTLAAYDVVILGEFTLTSSQAGMLSTWVQSGGNLIAMRPDPQLASILGLGAISSTLSNAYLLLNTSQGPGLGLVNQTIQFHGAADLYSGTSATSLATLYTTADTTANAPAITLVNSGQGQAAAFTYDLARSVVETRQGNPAWSGMERDGFPPIRSNDLFFGAAASDPEPDWIDLNKVAIPQADEQQRMLANLILLMNQQRKPLPRFWYLPHGYPAAVVMTGDDHANGGTAGRFNTYLADSPAGCSVADWQCVRSTSYLYPGSPLTDAQAASFVSQGFEVALHVTTNCADWTPATLENFYATQLASWESQYTSEPAPQTNRTHCIAWSDYDTQPQVELNHGIRLDTSYYYWPPSWILDRPGMFTGSGMPMRFAKADGTRIDVYQATTQMTDESGQSYPYNIDTLLSNAVGPLGYYGVFTANMHTDFVQSAGSDAIVASAQSRGVPIVSSVQMLRWLDGRNQSSFGSLTWTGTSLQFTVAQAPGANGIQGMVPTVSPTGLLSGIQYNGNAISFTTQFIKGIQYAVFPALTGSYVVSYAADTTPPTISNISSSVSNQTSVISWTTDKVSSSVVNYGTSASNLNAVASTPGSVTAHSVTIAGLAPSTTYYYQVTSTDSFGNTATAPATPASFQTAAATVSDTSAADFASGTGSCSAVTMIQAGAVILTPAVDVEFPGSSLPAGWSSTTWSSGGGYTVAGGSVTVDGADVFSAASYGPGLSLEFVGSFSGQPFQHIGFVTDGSFDSPWAMFSTGASGGALYARVNTGGGNDNAVTIPGSWLGAPHRFRIDWTSSNFIFSIDGNVVATLSFPISSNMILGASDFTPGGGSVSLNWMRLSPYATSCSFNSRVLDAGGPANWSTLSWTADTPVNTSIAMSYRIGNTPSPDGSWSGFTNVGASPAGIGGNSRYIQYQANLATTDTTSTPALSGVNLSFVSGVGTTPPAITAQSPAPGATNVPVGTNVTVTFNEPMNATTINSSTFQLQDNLSNVVAAVVTYAGGVATLTPNAPLMSTTQYTVTIAGTVADTNGNQLGTNVSWIFTTGAVTLTHTDTTVADFSAGTTNCSVVAHVGDGEVILTPTIDEEFNSTFPTDWSITPWSTGGSATVTGGQLFVDGALAAANTFYGPGSSLEFVATFGAEQFQHVGFVQQLQSTNESWAMFSTFNTTNSLFARTDNNGTVSDFQIPNPSSGSWLGKPHRFRIDWTSSSVVFSIDGNVVNTQAVAITSTMRPGVSDFTPGDGIAVSVDWLVMTPYSSPCKFQSAVFDAGAPANWSTLSWTAIIPASTALNLSYRTGNTATPDGSWTAFTPVASSGGALAGTSRYFQYESDLSSSDLSQTPVLEDITIAYVAGPTQAPAITSANSTTFVVGIAGSFMVTATGNPTPSLSGGSESLPTGIAFVDNGNGTATLSGTPASGTAGQYSLTIVAHNSSGPDANQAFTLTINEAPSIATQPASQTINAGQTATLTVSATGTPSVTYQWYQGATGNTATPVGTNSSSFTTPALTATTAYWVRVSNVVGHADSQTATITVVAGTSATALTSSLNPSTFGQSVTFTATVTASGGGTPTGTVTFTDGSNALGTVSLSNGQASLSTSSLGAGSHSVVASYSGDSTYQASASASLTQTVRIAGTSLNLTSNINPSGYNQSVTFTASLTPQFGGSATGQITFSDGANPLGTITVSGNQAAITLSTLTVGTHSIAAVYGGDANFNGSSSGLSQVVVKAATSTALVSSLNPAFVTQNITYTATVTSAYGGAVSGSVTFKSGATTLGSATLVNGQAGINTSYSTSGSRSITATYIGDAKNTGSTSPVLTQAVNKYPTSTKVASNPNPSNIGQTVTFTATVSSSFGAIPDGDLVTFKDGAKTLVSVPLSGGTATMNTANLTLGTHAITAAYMGDTLLAASVSAVLKQQVNKYASTTTLAASPNPSSFGETVTFTATVTNGATGTVTFKSGAATLSTVALTGNSASLSTSALTAGSHSITAVYSGDGTYNGSTSPVVKQVVSKALTAESLSSSPNPSPSGQAVTFTATVTSSGGVPTGTVTFKKGATTVGTATLSSGVATFTTSTLPVGSSTITATYAGTANYSGSSASVTQVVH